MNVKNCMLASLVKIITLKMTSVKVVQHKLTSFFSRTNRPVTIESPAKDIREPEVLITGDYEADPATDQRKYAPGMLPIRPNISKYIEGPMGKFQERWYQQFEWLELSEEKNSAFCFV